MSFLLGLSFLSASISTEMVSTFDQDIGPSCEVVFSSEEKTLFEHQYVGPCGELDVEHVNRDVALVRFADSYGAFQHYAILMANELNGLSGELIVSTDSRFKGQRTVELNTVTIDGENLEVDESTSIEARLIAAKLLEKPMPLSMSVAEKNALYERSATLFIAEFATQHGYNICEEDESLVYYAIEQKGLFNLCWQPHLSSVRLVWSKAEERVNLGEGRFQPDGSIAFSNGEYTGYFDPRTMTFDVSP
ncbi:hypothetical protein [Thaumasiovibrio subtropicus]|uniref:hypothetical protein n=1 Tax=Thaumasiovibrio subtropicus TaxID=1891207 RepID=UPI000B34F354|nr:hypothetical protein [Thaumasiovibrio subtropicus]